MNKVKNGVYYFMTRKERKELKHTLKTLIDKSDTWIKLANAGDSIGATSDEESRQSTENTRNMIIEELLKKKAEIQTKTEGWIKEIDSAIAKMS